MVKEYLCKIENEFHDVLRKNPHTIHFFCDLKNIINCKNNKCNEKGYKYDRDIEEELDESNIKLEDIKNLYYQDSLNELFDKNNKLDYLARRQRPTTTIHWGQLKLFLSTLQFLLYYAPRSQKVHVVYAGSAWGNNINVITKMFPQCYWYLIDPRRHYNLLYKNPRVLEIKKEYFTNEVAMYYKNKLKGEFVLFITDIRDAPTEELIDQDLRMQQEWVKIIEPEYSQLKFRLPRIFKKYNYIEGVIYNQVYSPDTTTETRLVTKKGAKNIDYDVEDYEGKCYYHNRISRVCNYKQTIKHSKNYLDNCYDCTMFLLLLDKYKKKYKKMFDYGKIKDSNMDYLIDFVISQLGVYNKLETKTKDILDNLNF
tara:strand:+ start:48 stop:1151 length:1104 start_codon:yes stop_codon:yes gene_type:complete